MGVLFHQRYSVPEKAVTTQAVWEGGRNRQKPTKPNGYDKGSIKISESELRSIVLRLFIPYVTK